MCFESSPSALRGEGIEANGREGGGPGEGGGGPADGGPGGEATLNPQGPIRGPGEAGLDRASDGLQMRLNLVNGRSSRCEEMAGSLAPLLPHQEAGGSAPYDMRGLLESRGACLNGGRSKSRARHPWPSPAPVCTDGETEALKGKALEAHSAESSPSLLLLDYEVS